MLRSSSSICAFLCALGVAGGAAAGSEEETWAALQRGGMVVIMRHASAPGPSQGAEGDPADFILEDCSTQRNLSTFGRRQAAELGEEMRGHHVVFTRVLSSPWCRAKDTAALMNLGPSIEISNFLFKHSAIAPVAARQGCRKGCRPAWSPCRTLQIQGIIRAWRGPGNLMLVSHGNNEYGRGGWSGTCKLGRPSRRANRA